MVGGAFLARPLWSGWWNAEAQRAAAAVFREERAAAGGGAPTAPSGSTSGTAPAPSLPVKPPANPLSVVNRVLGLTGAAPTAAAGPGQVLARLVIPAIGVNSYVLEGLTYNPSVWESLLRRGPSHLEGSALPGADGNVVIFGHVNVWGAVFLNLDQLRAGDQVVLQTPGQSYVYRVTDSQVVAPKDTAALAPQPGAPTLQLVTCSGLWDTARLVVDAVLVPSVTSTATGSTVPASGGGAGAAATTTTDPVTAAVQAVRQYEADRIAGRWSAAYALLSPLMQGTTSQAQLQAEPAPASVSVSDAWAIAGTESEVVVHEQSSAGQTQVVAFAVDRDGVAARIVGVRLVHFKPPLILSIPPPPASGAWLQGDMLCGPDRVHWRVGPVQPVSEHGFTFGVRLGNVAVTGPSGQSVPGIQVSGLALGTYPVACGDLTGDGSESLILRTALPQDGASQISVFRLDAGGAALIGQMLSYGAGYPRLVPTQPHAGPYVIVVGSPPAAGGNAPPDPSWWAFSAGRFRLMLGSAATG